MNKKQKHNYPKTRKKRDVSYSMSYKLIEAYGLDHIRTVWEKKGIYRTCWQLGKSVRCTPWVIREIVHKNGWKRPAERSPIILKGVLAGNMRADFYKTLDFSNINLTKEQNER